MVPAHSPYAPRHLVVIGVFSLLLSLGGLLAGCRTGPQTIEIENPPVTFVQHIDVALMLVHDLPLSVLNTVYADAAQNLSLLETEQDSFFHAQELAYRLDAYMRNADAPSGEDLLRWAQMWNRLASLEGEYASRASEVSRNVATRFGSLEDETVAGPLLVRLLEAQLLNGNAEEEPIRRNLDELYLLGNDTERAKALVDAADLIRVQGGITALNPVVQQAIAIVPVVESATIAMMLNVRLSDLSETLGNRRDVRALRDQAVRRAEAGLLVSEEDRPAIRRVLEILIGNAYDPGTEVIVENIAPAASRSLAYADLGAVIREEQRTAGTQYFDEARSIAFSIDDPTTRARTVAAAVLIQVESDPEWAPSAVIADLIGSVELGRFSPVDRVHLLATLHTALFLAGRPEETTRFRGFIRSADELALINITVGEMLVERDRLEAASDQVSQVERVPPREVGAEDSVAFRIARVWVDLGEYDRAISVLQDADRGERARILVRIPASHRPNPAAVTDLERLLES